jgi:UDP:flavonoid glycosyltransferase YjiC (YdhE family)
VIAVPQIPEQQVVARRVEELGLGRVLTDVESLRNTVAEVAGDAEIRRRVMAMSRTVRDGGGAVAGADVLQSARPSAPVK